MSKTIRCDIVSAQEEIYSGEAAMIFATGTVGAFAKAGLVRVERGAIEILDRKGLESEIAD